VAIEWHSRNCGKISLARQRARSRRTTICRGFVARAGALFAVIVPLSATFSRCLPGHAGAGCATVMTAAHCTRQPMRLILKSKPAEEV
jgi:hypothetical protein